MSGVRLWVPFGKGGSGGEHFLGQLCDLFRYENASNQECDGCLSILLRMGWRTDIVNGAVVPG